MKKKIIKIYSKKKCKDYKNLTGDLNFIHYKKNINLISAFKKPIVYATLILEDVLNLKIIGNQKFTLDAVFKKPVFIGEKVYFVINSSKEKVSIQILNNLNFKGYIVIKFIKEYDNKYKDSVIINLRKLTNKVGNYKKNINLISNINIKPSSNFTHDNFLNLNHNTFVYSRNNNCILSKSLFLSFNKELKIRKLNYKKIKYNINKFKNKKVLIIGVNSGIGGLFYDFFNNSKISFNGTFNTNKKNNIKKSFKLNLNKINNKDLKKISKFDYIFYLASPKIFSISDVIFDFKRLNEFNKIYLNSLSKIINYLSKIDKKFIFFIPSTIMVDNKTDNFEYAASKRVQEDYIKFIKKKTKNIKFYNPRLDAIHTNSTKNLAFSDKDYEKFLSYILKKI